MIQRKTLVIGIKDESAGIEYYGNLIRLADTEEEKNLYRHIQNQEREHKKILEYKLKTFTEKKGQTDITKLLSI